MVTEGQGGGTTGARVSRPAPAAALPMLADGLPSPNWYPGHMRVAERELRDRLRLLDVLIEVADARAPASSRNARFAELCQARGHVLVLAKADLAAPHARDAWVAHYRRQGAGCLTLDLRAPAAAASLRRALRQAVPSRARPATGRAALIRPTRIAVVGVPNAGKSTLVNLLVGRRRARTGPLPGVTRQQQWVPLGEDMELLDTPGVLLPRLPDRETGLRLGLVAALKDETVGGQALAAYFLHVCARDRHLDWLGRYGLDRLPATVDALLAAVGASAGAVRRGGGVDSVRAAVVLLQDFRAGRLGRFALDGSPPAS